MVIGNQFKEKKSKNKQTFGIEHIAPVYISRKFTSLMQTPPHSLYWVEVLYRVLNGGQRGVAVQNDTASIGNFIFGFAWYQLHVRAIEISPLQKSRRRYFQHCST